MATPLIPPDFKEFLQLLNANHVEYPLIGWQRNSSLKIRYDKPGRMAKRQCKDRSRQNSNAPFV